MRKERLLDKISLEELIELYNKMGVKYISEMYGCSDQTVYNNLKGHVHGRGGKHAKRIPRHEICKDTAEEMQQMAEQNAENACVMLAKCWVALTASVGEYTIDTSKKMVVISIDGSVIEVEIDKIPELIEELKAVGRCAKSFEFGNAMW